MTRRLDALPSKRDRPGPCPPLATLLDAYGPGGSAPEVLYFGGSESLEVSWSDWSKKPLGKMVRRRLDPARMCQVTQTAYNSRVYLAALRALAAMPLRPKVVMVPINLRQFSPPWSSNPNFGFQGEIEAMEQYADDPSVGVATVDPFPRRSDFIRTGADPETWQQYMDTPVSYSGLPHRTIGEFMAQIDKPAVTAGDREHRAKLAYEFNYRFPPDGDHVRLRAAAEVFAQVEALGSQIVCWFHPLNHEVGRELLGVAWDESIDALAEMVRDRCGPSNHIHDWLELLPQDCFYDSVEHFNETGRAIVANRMAEAARDALARGSFNDLSRTQDVRADLRSPQGRADGAEPRRT